MPLGFRFLPLSFSSEGVVVRWYEKQGASDIQITSFADTVGLFSCLNSEGIWIIWRNAGGICERKTLFRMKKNKRIKPDLRTREHASVDDDTDTQINSTRSLVH